MNFSLSTFPIYSFFLIFVTTICTETGILEAIEKF